MKSLENALELIKDMRQSLEGHYNYNDYFDEVIGMLEHYNIATENILLCLKQHEERIAKLELLKDGLEITLKLWTPILQDIIERLKLLEAK